MSERIEMLVFRHFDFTQHSGIPTGLEVQDWTAFDDKKFA